MDRKQALEKLTEWDASARSKRQAQERQDAQTRADHEAGMACWREYLELAGSYQNFCLTISYPHATSTPTIVLKNDLQMPELGRGRLAATIDGHDSQDQPHMLREAASFHTQFTFTTESDQVYSYAPERLEADMETSLTAQPKLATVSKWDGTAVDAARSALDGMLPPARDTLAWLQEAAANPDLNPTLAPLMHSAAEA